MTKMAAYNEDNYKQLHLSAIVAYSWTSVMLAATLVTIVSGKATPLSVHVINKANIPIVIKHDVRTH